MPKISLVRKFNHCQIEFPDTMPHPSGRRGGRGTSLHLQRNAYRDVTDEELAFIKETRPDIFASLRIHNPGVVPKRTKQRLAAAQPKPARRRKRK